MARTSWASFRVVYQLLNRHVRRGRFVWCELVNKGYRRLLSPSSVIRSPADRPRFAQNLNPKRGTVGPRRDPSREERGEVWLINLPDDVLLTGGLCRDPVRGPSDAAWEIPETKLGHDRTNYRHSDQPSHIRKMYDRFYAIPELPVRRGASAGKATDSILSQE